jgi:antitoxin (DNA-binding transcriptional repressor) of toxin-antitoxin stability system
MIQTMHIGDFKARFSEIVELIKKGVTIKVIKGRSGEVVGYFGKDVPPAEKKERRLGSLSHLGIDIKKEDLEWSDEELQEMGLI